MWWSVVPTAVLSPGEVILPLVLKGCVMCRAECVYLRMYVHTYFTLHFISAEAMGMFLHVTLTKNTISFNLV